jgi:signal transduction histidine kinase
MSLFFMGAGATLEEPAEREYLPRGVFRRQKAGTWPLVQSLRDVQRRLDRAFGSPPHRVEAVFPVRRNPRQAVEASSRCYDRPVSAEAQPIPSRLPRTFLRQVPTIRRALLLGFAAVFLLWLFSAYDLARRVAEGDAQAATLMTRFTGAEEVLSTVGAEVILSSVYLRDAVLDTRPDAAEFYAERLRTTRASVERALQRYLPNVDSDVEREHWTRLQAELQTYWSSVSPALDIPTAASAADAYAFVRREVIPKRETVIGIANDIRTLNQDALQEQQRSLAQIHRVVRERIWWTSGVAVALGLLIAGFAGRHAAWLEARIQQQHHQEQRHKQDLQRLSAELVHAQEDERRRIARDLHDEIGQALLTVRLDLGVIERSGQLSGGLGRAVAEARSTTDNAIHAVRDLSQLLHPPVLDDFGLALTLDAYVRRFSERSGVRTELVLDRMDERLSPELEICAYRVIQEALTNVAKHAEASSCCVYLQRLPHSLLVTVEDDGRGISSLVSEGTKSEHGVGLIGVRERVAGMGGSVRLETRAGKGTRLTIELPVTAGRTPARETGPDRTQVVA